ncbi:MAG: inositol monophosphatase family protein [Enterococcus sp.]
MLALANEIKGWILEAGEKIKSGLAQNSSLEVLTKKDRKDLVTNVDQEIQQFLVEKILLFDPQAKIMGEENGKDSLTDLSGRVFIIDPIDGTMNFVLERENFCVMVALYEDGVGKLGFIFNVMKNEFVWGGAEIGVFCNDERLPEPLDLSLRDSLVGMNAAMLMKNFKNCQLIGQEALGVRMTGCAGVELSAILLGRRGGYVSNLAPWDYAAGNVLLQAFGFSYGTITGENLRFDGREYYIAGTKSAFAEMLAIIKA